MLLNRLTDRTVNAGSRQKILLRLVLIGLTLLAVWGVKQLQKQQSQTTPQSPDVIPVTLLAPDAVPDGSE